jgi:hypothetical protein
MPASKRGFWRNNAASKVEPERGRPEMKWMVAIGALLAFARAVGAADRQPTSHAVHVMLTGKEHNNRSTPTPPSGAAWVAGGTGGAGAVES